ncbi:glucosyltransferase domain-containing protein [Mesorhizobium sp. VK24D]|uniref:Glucosyltransferase domain-containing protein n=1 Tax=Mesorhizobium album TaxID=3072314 RepID=A0ABU4Y2V0_9HYPH|nr:glucosyltransferase domain-containing protein [Mesorhizobium sp. VK24D]MDX8481258.1 glucosyltransferase domain-containing protein [Mesorhizobium sp. VK24D]
MYFSELASFSLSVDEEVAAFRTDASIWIAQGRWGAYLIETFLIPNPVMPLLAPAVFGAGCVVAYLLVMDAIDKHELSIAEYACFAIFCAFPTWFFIVEFYSNIAAVGIGMAASALAVWLIGEKNIPVASSRFLVAIAAGGYAISIYQSFAPAILVLGIAVCVLQARAGSERSLPKDLIRVGVMVTGSAIFYVVGNAIFKSFTSQRSEYFESLFQPGFLFQHPMVVTGRVLEALGGALGLDHGTYGVILWAVPLLVALGGWTLFKESPRTRLLLLAAALVCLFIPFGVHVLAAGIMPVRSLVGLPIAVWLFVYLAVTSSNARISIVSAILLGVVTFQIQVIQNYRQASSYLVDKHDTLLAAAIYDRLAATPGFDTKRSYALSVFGGLPFATNYPRPPSSTVGYSFFEWDGGNPWRITYYMKLLGYSNLNGPTDQQVDQTIVRLSTMPVWPVPGSLEIQGDIVLIRLGESPSYANQQALARAVH